MWTHCCNHNIEMTLAQARSASHSGECEADVLRLMRHPKIQRQLRKVDAEALRRGLAEYGAWDDAELADHQQNLVRLVWLAAGVIAEENA